MESNERDERLSPVEVGATPHGVVWKVFGVLLVAKVLERVGPEQVAHGTERRRLLEPVQLAHVVQRVDLRRQAAVHAQELLVHERGERQAVERLHARVVNALRVLDFACNPHCSTSFPFTSIDTRSTSRGKHTSFTMGNRASASWADQTSTNTVTFECVNTRRSSTAFWFVANTRVIVACKQTTHAQM